MPNILIRILQLLMHLPLMTTQIRRFRLSPFTQRHTPTPMLNPRRNIPRQRIRIRSRQIHIQRPRRTIKRIKRMHGLDFSGIRFHAPSCLSGFDVAPYHGRHVALVVHEAGVEVRGVVGVGGHDVRGAAGEGVFEEVEHGEEFAGGHEHVVAEPASNDSCCR